MKMPKKRQKKAKMISENCSMLKARMLLEARKSSLKKMSIFCFALLHKS